MGMCAKREKQDRREACVCFRGRAGSTEKCPPRTVQWGASDPSSDLRLQVLEKRHLVALVQGT